MQFINVTENNIDTEHICCVMSDKKGENCIKSKKDWMKQRFKEGLVFKKLNVKGKVFIEYIPAEYAWYPFDAEGFMVIDCLWVSGRYKGQGIANMLLDECIKDSKNKGKKGIVVLSSKKKKAFLSDGNYFKHNGFVIADRANNDYELLYLPFKGSEKVPTIKECAKKCMIEEKCMKIYYTNQCPYTEKYVNIIKQIAYDKGVELKIEKFESREQSQNSPTPFTTYSFFYNGKLIGNEILSETKFLKFLNKNNLI